jgi:heat shock protein HslJ
MRKVIALLALILGISLTACSLNVVDNLAGTSWVLDSWANETLSPEGYGITMEFGHDGGTNGRSSVNNYGSAYKVKKDNMLVFSNTASTDMASTDEDRNKAESIYMKFLSEVQYYEISGENLMLKDKGKSVIMIFHNVPFPADSE